MATKWNNLLDKETKWSYNTTINSKMELNKTIEKSFLLQ